MAKASDNEFPKIIGVEQASDPAAPAAGTRKLYPKADGWYDEDSDGVVTGPLGTGGGGGGGGVTVAKYQGPGTGPDLTTASTTFVDIGAYSATVPAAAGDEIEITLTGSAYSNGGSVNIDFQFAINGTLKGIIWRHRTAAAVQPVDVTLSYTHTVVAGDISGGNVTVVPRWLTANASFTAAWADAPGPITGQLVLKNFG